MISDTSEQVRLMWGSDIISKAPLISQVFSVMKTIEEENGMGGPPELTLNHISIQEGAERSICRLMLLPAFHLTKPLKWIVHFIITKGRGSQLLAGRVPILDDCEVRTCCGVISQYRVECLLSEDATIRSAVEWFLEHHSPCPHLTWIAYTNAVRDDVS